MDRKRLHEMVEIAQSLVKWLEEKGVLESECCVLRNLVEQIQYAGWETRQEIALEERVKQLKKEKKDEPAETGGQLGLSQQAPE